MFSEFPEFPEFTEEIKLEIAKYATERKEDFQKSYELLQLSIRYTYSLRFEKNQRVSDDDMLANRYWDQAIKGVTLEHLQRLQSFYDWKHKETSNTLGQLLNRIIKGKEIKTIYGFSLV